MEDEDKVGVLIELGFFKFLKKAETDQKKAETDQKYEETDQKLGETD